MCKKACNKCIIPKKDIQPDKCSEVEVPLNKSSTEMVVDEEFQIWGTYNKIICEKRA